jgi:hypothetical protein
VRHGSSLQVLLTGTTGFEPWLAMQAHRGVTLVTDRFSTWIAACEAAWRTEGAENLFELFTADATYQAAPFDDPLTGLPLVLCSC